MKKILTQYRTEILKNAFGTTKALKAFAVGGFSLLFIFTAIGAQLLRKEAKEARDYAILYQTEDAPTTETLLVNLKVSPDPNSATPLTLGSIAQYNSRVDTAIKIESTYTLNIVNNGEVIYSTNFDIPTVHSESINPDTGEYVSLSVSSVDAISFRIPYFNEGVTLEVTNKAGDTILADTIRDVQVIKNDAPNYTTTRGDEAVKKED